MAAPARRDPGGVAEAMSAPLGSMIAAIGRGVAEAQEALDDQALRRFKAMHRAGAGVAEEMRELGFTPTWYRIPEVEAEITVSLSLTGETREGATAGPDAPVGGPGRVSLNAAPVDASYAGKYDFDFNAASRVKLKIVAVPPSAETAAARVVPELEGLEFAVARQLLAARGIELADEPPEVGDDNRVREVEPPAGSILKPGQTVRVEF